MCSCVPPRTVLVTLLVCGLCTVSSLFLSDGCDQECGEPIIQPHSVRVVGGRESVPGALPWTTILAWCDVAICGGAIINNQFILTAAHCFDEPRYPCFRLNSKETRHPNNWTVYAGKHNIYRSNVGEEMYQVEKIILHPGYDNQTHTNDVALLKLKVNITYTSLIRPICIPSQSEILTTGQPCIVAGYGDSLEGVPFSLKQVTVPVVSDEQCRQPDWYGTTFYAITEQFCAGFAEGGMDACDGDSGSPLSCKFHGKWFASGIVSKGLGCAEDKKPGIYSNVSYHEVWIRTAMSGFGFSQSCS